MPKSSKQQIDEDEKKFLLMLQQNSGENIDNIAKKCGFSRQKVWRIKKRLEKNKTIWGYNVVVDNEKLGLKQYIILIKRSNVPLSEEQLETIASRKLKEETLKLGINIESSYFIHGSYDWFFIVTAKSIRDVKKVVEGFSRLLSGVISEIKIQEVIFSVENNNFSNPNLNQIKDFFG
jgi:DNA-binding Lrp family transcriptional regulator